MFATAKVYSVQYSLWIFAALAIDGAPVALAVAFALLDLLIFASTFGPLYPAGPIASDFPLAIQWGAYGLRQLFTAWLAIGLVRRRLSPDAAAPEPRAAGADEPCQMTSARDLLTKGSSCARDMRCRPVGR